jgi:hypothetical protein
MIQRSDSDRHRIKAVRDGQGAPVTCAACGCRLERAPATRDLPTWFHFGRFGGRDARGDRVDCVDLPHDAFGLPLAPVAA